jgi:transcription elongation GreA/GreB family factor
MANYNELIVSTSDAEALARLVGERRTSRVEAEAADALAGALMDARMVAHDRLPPDRVAMDLRVAYREEPRGERRTVAIVHPRRADPAKGAISVLSPVGRALLGRKVGDVAAIDLPGGRALTIRVVAIEDPRLKEAA